MGGAGTLQCSRPGRLAVFQMCPRPHIYYIRNANVQMCRAALFQQNMFVLAVFSVAHSRRKKKARNRKTRKSQSRRYSRDVDFKCAHGNVPAKSWITGR